MSSITDEIQLAARDLPRDQQERLLAFARALRQKLADEEARIWAEAGMSAAATVLEPEDFSNWRKQS